MARVSQFEFYDDPVAHTGSSVCTINWTAQTVAWPGVVGIPFSVLANVKADINLEADQNLADGEADIRHDIYAGTILELNVSCAVDMATGTVNTISPGASAMSKAKAKDLAVGLDTFVLSAI